jgi:hypothetical protein
LDNLCNAVDDLAALLHAVHGVFATIAILGSGKGSRRITAAAAQRMQTGADGVGETLIWTVYGSPTKFVARPCMTSGGVTAMPVHLEASTLERPHPHRPAAGR